MYRKRGISNYYGRMNAGRRIACPCMRVNSVRRGQRRGKRGVVGCILRRRR